MKILWVSYQDNYLNGVQFKLLAEKYTPHTVKVLTFLNSSSEKHYMNDIIFSELENLEPEYVLPKEFNKIKECIKDSDMAMVSHGVLPEYYNQDFRKPDGEFARFGDIYLWLSLIEKPTISVLYPNNSLYHNIDYFSKVYRSTGKRFLTFDWYLYTLLENSMDIDYFVPPIFLDWFNRSPFSIKRNIKFLPLQNRESKLLKTFITNDIHIKHQSKLDYMFGYYGDKFLPSYDLFEDIALGIIPIVSDKNDDNFKGFILESGLKEDIFIEPKDIEEYSYIYSDVINTRNIELNQEKLLKQMFNKIREVMNG